MDSKPFIWAYLIHLSYNMWADREGPDIKGKYYSAKPYLRCDDSLWNDLLPRMRDAGVNMLIIDVGDAVKFESHPEIPLRDAWPISKLKTQIQRCRELGLEPIPKLNFSTCHDQWLGKYARMVSTPEYYQVCKDLIAETIEIFDTPRFFHLGMDEEAQVHQQRFAYVVIRQHELWWHDFNFYLDQLKPKQVRPWIWSDMIWIKRDEFLAQMPKSVLQSNWYYGPEFNDRVEVKSYDDLDKQGFEQVPTFSNWETAQNVYNTVRYCKQHVAKQRLLGFMHAPWRPTLEEVRDRHLDAIDNIRQAKHIFETA
jgi:hypothetical protein